jgi:heme/copper-type cytochrome/quinol oxidase subunit 2
MLSNNFVFGSLLIVIGILFFLITFLLHIKEKNNDENLNPYLYSKHLVSLGFSILLILLGLHKMFN